MGKWEEVCAALVTPKGRLLAIRRAAQSDNDYYELPRWPVAPGEPREAALVSALRERLAADVSLHSLLHVTTVYPDTTSFLYLTRVSQWSTAQLPSDPSFVQLLEIPFIADHAGDVDVSDLEPFPVSGFLSKQARSGTDLFALPDLRAEYPDIRPRR
jgi:hypothetical protein